MLSLTQVVNEIARVLKHACVIPTEEAIPDRLANLWIKFHTRFNEETRRSSDRGNDRPGPRAYWVIIQDWPKTTLRCQTGTGRLEVEVIEKRSKEPDEIRLTVWAGTKPEPGKVVTLLFRFFTNEGGWDCEVVQFDPTLIEEKEERERRLSLLFEVIEKIPDLAQALEAWERSTDPGDWPNRFILEEYRRWQQQVDEAEKADLIRYSDAGRKISLTDEDIAAWKAAPPGREELDAIANQTPAEREEAAAKLVREGLSKVLGKRPKRRGRVTPSD